MGMLLVSMPPATFAQDEPAEAGLRAHSLFQSHMVIQRDKPVDVWGWAKSGDEVIVTFSGNSVSGTTDKEGKWMVQLPAMEASSEPATMTRPGRRVSHPLGRENGRLQRTDSL